MVLNDKMNEIKRNVNENIIKIYNHNNGNNTNNFRHPKLINFLINYRSNNYK